MYRLIVAVLLVIGSSIAYGQTQRVESDRFHYLIAPPPDWVVSPGPPPASTAPPGEPIQYLSSDRQVDVESETEYVAMHFRILQSSGIRELSEISIDFAPDYQSLTLHGIAVVREGKTLDRLDPRDIRLIQAENDLDSRIYSGMVTAVVILRDVRVGDEVVYSYSRKGRNPVFGNRIATGFAAGWQVPVARNQVRVRTPAGRPLHYRGHGIELAPSITSKDGYQEYVWRQEPVAAIRDEGQYPQWYQPYPWVQISEYRDWSEVAAWANALFRYQGPLPEPLRSRIRQWQREERAPDGALLSALRFVQEEIRYLGLELGQNSHRPATPDQTLERRYGDCKDKTLLLVTMLRELGIEAYPALVSLNRARGIEQLLPSHHAFDHAIVMARHGGRTYWLDGTRTHQRGGLDTLGFTRFGKALVVAAGSRGLTAVEPPANYRNGSQVAERFQVTRFEAPVELQVVSTHRGNRADWQREYFASRNRAEIGHAYINYYARQWPGIELRAPVEIEDDERHNRFVVREHYRIPDFWDREKNTLVASLRAGAIREFIKLPDTIARRAPLSLAYPVELNHTSILELPPRMPVAGEDETVEFKDPHLAYRVATHHSENRFEVTHNLQTRADHVAAGEVGAYVRQLNAIWEHMTYVYYAPYSNEVVAGDMVKNLIDRLGRFETNQ